MCKYFLQGNISLPKHLYLFPSQKDVVLTEQKIKADFGIGAWFSPSLNPNMLLKKIHNYYSNLSYLLISGQHLIFVLFLYCFVFDLKSFSFSQTILNIYYYCIQFCIQIRILLFRQKGKSLNQLLLGFWPLGYCLRCYLGLISKEKKHAHSLWRLEHKQV